MNIILVPFEDSPHNIQSGLIMLDDYRRNTFEVPFIRPNCRTKLLLTDPQETWEAYTIKLKFRRKRPSPMYNNTWDYVLDWDNFIEQLCNINRNKEDIMQRETQKKESQQYVIVRTYSAGVFAGYLTRRDGKEVELTNARRLWYWDGAASLSQLAMEGVSKPQNCKFPCEVDRVILTEAIEILDCTKEAQQSIKDVPIWKA